MSDFENNFMEIKVSDKNSNSSNSSKESENRYTIETREWLTTPKQIYRGSLLYDNLHGSGIYFIDKEDKIFYDGLFYTNKMQGYCQVFYHKNGTNFQGLFKDNRRFGPGVLTYPDGNQDIGLWDGFSLIRVGKTNNSCIPTLSTTNEGHIKVLRYRNLVDVCPKEEPDIAQELLKNLGANAEVLSKAKELYCKDVKNKNSLFFNKKMYDQYYPEKKPTIEILIEDTLPCLSKNVIFDEEIELEHVESVENEGQESNQFSKKVSMLNNYLDEIGKRLNHIKTQIAILSKKIDYCTKCCEEPESAQPDITQSKNKEEINDLQKPLSVIQSPHGIADAPTGVDGNQSTISIATWSLSQTISNLHTTSVATSTHAKSLESGLISEYFKNQECLCLDEMEIEDLTELEQKLQKFTKEELFYEQIYKHLKLEIKKYLRSMKSTKSIQTQKIVVNQILAWNNEPLIVKMLKHSFFHRNTENIVNFRVPAILSGHRIGFGIPGIQEQRCYEFFKECSTGSSTLGVIRYLRKYQINVNVTDSKGNSGLFFAAVNNKLDIIRILVQFGANLNLINDDGLTPLSMTLLNYLARKNNITNWESAFIPDTIVSPEDQQELKSWYPSRSFLTITGDAEVSNLSIAKKVPRISQVSLKNYIFSTKFPNYILEQKENKSTESVIKSEHQNATFLQQIENCIKRLIDLGAKSNYGESPLPTFLLTIYCENFNLVKKFLENGADPNLVTSDENLNGLHILASNKFTEENIYINTLLLRYHCDPNTRTNQSHWPEQKLKLTFDAPYKDKIEEDLGKNVLHTLCLRTDFASDNCSYFKKVALALLHKVDVKATYLGLDALRLAMVSGNLNLVDNLLRSGLFDPYSYVPNEGTVLTMLLSDRYQNILPQDVKRDIIELLFNSNVNPLTPFDEHDNVLDYINKTYKQNVDKFKSSTKGVNKLFNKLEEFLRQLFIRNIFENIAMNITHLLYDFAEDNKLDSELLKHLLEYITSHKFLQNLKLLFNYGRIPTERFNKDLVLKVIDYLMENSKSVSKSLSDIAFYGTLIDEMDFRMAISTEKKIKLEPPGLDEQSKYLVCFECLKKIDKLYCCPKCRFVHFCGEKCFQTNLQRKTNVHPCKVVMFTDKDAEETDKEGHDILEEWKVVKANCKKRWERLQKEQALTQQLVEKNEKKPVRVSKKRDQKISKRIMKNSINFTPKTSRVSREQFLEVSQKLRRYSEIKETASSSKGRKTTEENDNASIRTDTRKQSAEKMDNLSPKYTDKGIKRDVSNATGKHEKPTSCRCNMNVSEILSKYPETIISSHFEPLPNLKEPYLIRKTSKIPAKPHFFMEILTKLFPDIHLSELLLPYTCYSDGGHLYYEFKNTNLFSRNYSIL